MQHHKSGTTVRKTVGFLGVFLARAFRVGFAFPVDTHVKSNSYGDPCIARWTRWTGQYVLDLGVVENGAVVLEHYVIRRSAATNEFQINDRASKTGAREVETLIAGNFYREIIPIYIMVTLLQRLSCFSNLCVPSFFALRFVFRCS